MDKFKVIYGSSTGNTERAARKIAAALGVEALNVANATSADFDAELLILGSSTWGLGELQDDWSSRVHLLTPANLQGKRVAVFGTGDQSGFSDTFCDAIGILATRAEEAGAGSDGGLVYFGTGGNGACRIELHGDVVRSE